MLFKKPRETPGDYVLNIEQFAEPTLLRAKRVEVGTISRFIEERCLDSGENYVLAYDTSFTAVLRCSVYRVFDLMGPGIFFTLRVQPLVQTGDCLEVKRGFQNDC